MARGRARWASRAKQFRAHHTAFAALPVVEETPVAPQLRWHEHYIEGYAGRNTSSHTPRSEEKGRQHDP